jgi:hypothetical protein
LGTPPPGGATIANEILAGRSSTPQASSNPAKRPPEWWEQTSPGLHAPLLWSVRTPLLMLERYLVSQLATHFKTPVSTWVEMARTTMHSCAVLLNLRCQCGLNRHIDLQLPRSNELAVEGIQQRPFDVGNATKAIQTPHSTGPPSEALPMRQGHFPDVLQQADDQAPTHALARRLRATRYMKPVQGAPLFAPPS